MLGQNQAGQKSKACQWSANESIDIIRWTIFSVEYTVPLIRKMESKILVPLKNSPMQ